ncbi:MAG: response regulator [Opitutaceae bacterium]|nr:response regulator [Opitutaceae bacterium]
MRRQAEETALRGLAPDSAGVLSVEALLQTLQELRVHQIELEMQSEELRRAHDELDTAEARSFGFYDLAPVGCVTVGESGLIRQANLTTATLPVAPAVSAGVPAAEAARAVSVLVTEDSPVVHRAVVQVLRRLGFSVLTAADGIAAVKVFREHAAEIFCVLCDLTMPRMNGWETLAALRQIAPGIPVVLMSGYWEGQAMAGNHPERPQAFMRKPYSPEVRVGAITQVLARRKG